ncbi:hypothetical protein FPCIR_13960 [Fusarium pseudocircinatum]|uniref:Uncharacterized protein n=1 Tax=Fusarium pseudocircinatum TaxID=56676 RepID=A0A8H5NQR2_9HYPO|nr:hypothetical protein FPCIR_13960 [Fusarium pseudocircinatum]
MVATLKSLVAEVRTEACKLNRLKAGDYTSPAELQKDIKNIYTLLDAKIKELESAVEHIVTANGLSNLDSMRKTGSIQREKSNLEGSQSSGAQATSQNSHQRQTEKDGQLESSSRRYKEYIDGRHDIPTLELQQLGEDLAATIDALASDDNQIQ